MVIKLRVLYICRCNSIFCTGCRKFLQYRYHTKYHASCNCPLNKAIHNKNLHLPSCGNSGLWDLIAAQSHQNSNFFFRTVDRNGLGFAVCRHLKDCLYAISTAFKTADLACKGRCTAVYCFCASTADCFPCPQEGLLFKGLGYDDFCCTVAIVYIYMLVHVAVVPDIVRVLVLVLEPIAKVDTSAYAVKHTTNSITNAIAIDKTFFMISPPFIVY